MTKSLITTALLTSALALTACSKVHNTEGTVQGQSFKGIINGETVSASDDIAKTTVQIFTFQVAHDDAGRALVRGVAGCTGTLLAEDILLTAAHCTTENPYYIILYFSNEAPKDFKAFMASINTNPLVRRVVGGKVGTQWPKLVSGKVGDWGDIALLKFEGGIPEGYQLAELLPAKEKLAVDQPITLAGFGITDGIKQTPSTQLLKVDVTILDPTYTKTEMVIDSGDKGPCHGDSGGPAYVTGSDGKKYVAGVTSRADVRNDPRGLCIGDTLYTKVQPHAAWIKRSMKSLQSPTFKPALIPQPQGG
ncbi:S1 family peptidase [Bdellovibrio sp. HCB337]|uniref:S1 family peptidase n=1 Tax=Bdellovibrio sp. HCB337 TaxID=3394358 RepID=UPI0039A50F2F